MKLSKKAQEGGNWFFYVGVIVTIILLVLVIIWLATQGSFLDALLK